MLEGAEDASDFEFGDSAKAGRLEIIWERDRRWLQGGDCPRRETITVRGELRWRRERRLANG